MGEVLYGEEEAAILVTTYFDESGYVHIYYNDNLAPILAQFDRALIFPPESG